MNISNDMYLWIYFAIYVAVGILCARIIFFKDDRKSVEQNVIGVIFFWPILLLIFVSALCFSAIMWLVVGEEGENKKVKKQALSNSPPPRRFPFNLSCESCGAVLMVNSRGCCSACGAPAGK